MNVYGGLTSLVSEFGLITGSATAAQLPDKPCVMVNIKARSANAGSFMIGAYSNQCLWELDAGQETGWIMVTNANQLWFANASGTAERLIWWVQR